MIDINLLRNPTSYQKLLDSENKRFKDPKIVENAKKLDQDIIKKQFEVENVAKDINKLNKEISSLYKINKQENKNINEDLEKLNLTNKKIDDLKLQKLNLETEKTKLSSELETLKKELNNNIKNIGNILDDRVCVSKDEVNNPIINTINGNENEYLKNTQQENKGEAKIRSHYEIMQMLGGIEMDRGAKVVGHRGYYLKGQLALLEEALAAYAIDFAMSKNDTDYTQIYVNKDSDSTETLNYEMEYIQTPTFVKKSIMEKTCQISEFDEQLYTLNNTHYLIATSEQPISALYMDERLEKNELPKYFIGDSLCYRKEAGAHGKDNQGIFRIHQFRKIEQFVITATPEQAESFHKKMVELTEEFLSSLNFNLRTVSIVSGEMNDAASYKYDIEAYFPSEGVFRELASISNCTDYQSRDLEVRFGASKVNNKKEYVMMLNGTLCAVHRTLCGFLEANQNEKGIKIPEVLRKYFGGKTFLGYKENS